MYRVKEIFYSLQGEGANFGRPAVFCRFAGCNLWSGWERDRALAICNFCDTEFVDVSGPGGGEFRSPAALADAISGCWPAKNRATASSLVVLTGGEPALQLDAPLIDALHEQGFWIALETNGTRPTPDGIDWLCVSPKAGTDLAVRRGNELKLVYPQAGLDPQDFLELEFEHFFLQPMDGPMFVENQRAATAYCLAHPRWRLSLQMHKQLGLP